MQRGQPLPLVIFLGVDPEHQFIADISGGGHSFDRQQRQQQRGEPPHAAMPVCLSRGRTSGWRPRKRTNASIASTLPPRREDGFAKPGRRFCVENTGFLESLEGIGGEHLGPFVAVVAGGVAPGEYVGETGGHPIEGRGRHDGDPLPHGGQRRGDIRTHPGIEIGVQLKIECREFDLPQRVERGVEGARAEQALQHVDRAAARRCRCALK